MRTIGTAILGILALLVAIPAAAQTPMTFDELNSAVNEAWKDAVTNGVKGPGSAIAGVSQVQSIGGDIYKIANAAQQAQALVNGYPDLTPQDGPFDPNYTPPGMPEVPVSCEGKEGCSACYAEAYTRLDKLRVSFEQLRVLYGSTMNWTKAEIAFGDSIAGSVGVGGLEWNVQRQRIEASVGILNQAYDKKYTQLLGSLKQTLMSISVCEAKEFNDPDWYNRFGYMFYTFMAARYQR